jgi:hypothetical protein
MKGNENPFSPKTSKKKIDTKEFSKVSKMTSKKINGENQENLAKID